MSQKNTIHLNSTMLSVNNSDIDITNLGEARHHAGTSFKE